MTLLPRLDGPAIAALLFATTAQATVLEIVLPEQECGLVMFDVYGSYKWPGGGGDSKYGMLCQNPNAVVSLYASLYTYCPADEIAPGLAVMNSRCLSHGDVPLADGPSLYAANLTKTAIAALPVLDAKALAKNAKVTHAFLMSQAWFDATARSEHWHDQEQRLRVYFAFAEYGFWALVLGFALTQNVVRKLVDTRRGYVYTDAEGNGAAAGRPPASSQPTRILGRVTAFVRKHISTPRVLPAPYHSRRVLGCTIPTRAESLVVVAYWAFCIILGAVDIHSVPGDTIWKWPAAAVARFLADRNGTMAYGNLPLLWVFSGRNNVLLWLTGWKFGTFNVFHRHVARIVTVQAIVHGSSYSAYYFLDMTGRSDSADYLAQFDQLWWCLGIASVTILSILTVTSSFPLIRAKFYEHFLLVHIVLSVVLLTFLYQHTKHFDLTMYNYPFLVTTAVLWAADRLLRLVRQAYINLHVGRNRAGRILQTTTASASYHEAANILVIDVVPANTGLLSAGPGQHYYLYQPLRFLGWENHPFTLAHWRPQGGSDAKLHLQFWVRPYDGWTKKLANECRAKGNVNGSSSNNNDGNTTATVTTMSAGLLLEGPYGASAPLHTFDEVLLIAGGSGISGVLSYLLDYVRRVDSSSGDRASGSGDIGRRIPTRTRHVTLVWADRREAYLRFIAEGPLAGLLVRPDMDIDVAFHNTGHSHTAPLSSSTASSSTDAVDSPVTPVDATAGAEVLDEKTVHELDRGKRGGVLETVTTTYSKKTTNGGSSSLSYRIQSGRPDVLSTVRRLAQTVQGTTTDARLAVMVCGPSSLADNVRHAVAETMDASRNSIEYFEESFGW